MTEQIKKLHLPIDEKIYKSFIKEKVIELLVVG